MDPVTCVGQQFVNDVHITPNKRSSHGDKNSLTFPTMITSPGSAQSVGEREKRKTVKSDKSSF